MTHTNQAYRPMGRGFFFDVHGELAIDARGCTDVSAVLYGSPYGLYTICLVACICWCLYHEIQWAHIWLLSTRLNPCPNFLFLSHFCVINFQLDPRKLKCNFGPISRRYELWRRVNVSRRHWRRATCRAVVHQLTRRRRGTELDAKIYSAELECVTAELV
jgi:hypothetical protein